MFDFVSPLLSYVLLGFVGLFLVYWFLLRDKGEQEEDDTMEEQVQGFVDDGRPKMLVLYGSQTGTAEEFSHTLAEEANQYGFNAIAMDMVDYEPESLVDEKFVVFLVATYGEGEPTDNARDFYEWLKDESHDSTLLQNTKFSVFGLGNKQYKVYQAMSRFFDKRLEELGATRVFKSGEGDADDNIEEDFEDWKANALPAFSEHFETNAELGEQVFEPKYNLQIIGDDVDGSEPYITARHLEPDAKNPFLSTVLVNKQLLRKNPENRSTVHVEFDLKGSKVRYEAGDHLAVLAENDPKLVNGYLSRLGAVDQMSKIIALMHKDGKKGNHFPKKTTLKNVLTYFIDLASLPRKKVLKALANYAQDEKEKEFLRLLSSNSDEGKQAYHKFITNKGRNTLDVLEELKSVKVPLAHFLELMPRLQPRYYSIASSSQIHKDSVHVVVAVVRYQIDNKTKEGICSSYLERITPGKKAYIYVRKSHFHLPKDTTTPVLMIGPGTGVAPFVGFLQQRRALKEAGKKLGDAYLYFGCRRAEEDFIYEEHLKEAETNGYISKLHVAFSRDQDSKIYVQHLIKRHSVEVWQVLSKGGYIFICGDAKYMAKDVEETLIKIVHEQGKKSLEEARDFIEKMHTDSRYQKDVWAP